jgi:hypothetical protein
LPKYSASWNPLDRKPVLNHHTVWAERCRRDPLYWAQNHTLTENPLYERMGVPFRAPLPKKSYFEVLFREFKECQRTNTPLFIPKSRDMITSWSGMIWATHQAQWYGAFAVVQTMKEEKAKQLIDYAACLHRNQPDWLKEQHALKNESMTELEWVSGGRIMGVPQGEHQIRTYKPTIYIMDEAAFLDDAAQCYAAVKASSSYVQILAISSAAPSWFGDECSH